MHDHRGVGAVRELPRAVVDAGLRLQRVAGRGVRDVAAGTAERVRPEVAAEPVDDLPGPLHAGARRAVVVAQVLAVRVDDRDAALGGAGRHVEPAHGERGEVGGLRLVLAPVVPRPAQLRTRRLQRAVGDRLGAVRDEHGDVVGRLVERVVVAREPPPGRLGLVGADPAVRGAVPTGEPVRLLGRGHPVVAHHDRQGRALGQRRLRRDHQLVLARGGEGGRHAVDPHLAHVEQEVQVEAGQVLRGLRQEGRGALQLVRRGLVLQPQVVVLDVVAAVAVGRVVGVADARRAGGEARGRRRDRQQYGSRGQRARCDESAVHECSKSSEQQIRSKPIHSPRAPAVHGRPCHTIAIRPSRAHPPQGCDPATADPRRPTGCPLLRGS